MPFWWQRRKRFWWGKRRPYYKRRKYTKRKRRFYRPKRRRAPRRRRRRRKKVRRKRQKIPVKQWQPSYITKCKIKGIQLFLLGAQGKQFVCFTDDKYSWTPPKAPGGGGFSAELYTLQYLYHEYIEGNNYWSRSNSTKDLVRYTGGYFKMYQHDKTDFIIYYDRNPKKEIDKYTYANMHPKELLLRKHCTILHSRKRKNYGKLYKKIKFKPPKKLQTHWHFMSEFAERPLIALTVAAVDLTHSYLSSVDTNQLISIYTLNTDWYQAPNWGKKTNTAWEPFSTIAKQLTVTYENGQTKTINMSNLSTYNQSVAYDTGWFRSDLLKAWKVQQMNNIPINALRYNPTIDDGTGNAVWLVSILKDKYDRPTVDKTMIVEGKPLWQLLYGYLSFLQKAKPDDNILKNYILCLSSPAIYPYKTTKDYHVPIDSTFINGKGPYEEYLTTKDKELWFPTVQHQQQSINNIVQCGPYIPKYGRDRESSWDLHGSYHFFFKWGGDEIDNQDVYNPTQQVTYETPDTIRQAIQISDPSQQIPQTIVHAWDIRRGLITPTALKRIRENLPIDEIISTYSDAEPKKKKRKNNNIPYQEQESQEIQNALQALFEKDTYQEPQDHQQLLNLIEQQHQQQNLLKFNLLQLIADLKKQQKAIQLHTGLLH